MALNMAGQVMEHSAKGAAVKGRNRAKLKNFEEQNRQYKTEVMLDNNEWKNNVQVQEGEQDQVYQAMITQWTEQDQQLDKIFAEADHKIEKAIVEMYENDYAGTQTGATAARLAGKGAKKLGQYKSQVLHNVMMAQDESILRKDTIHQKAKNDSIALHEKVKFAPIHGPTPIAPELEAKPSAAGLVLGLAKSAVTGYASAKAFTAPKIGSGLNLDPAPGMYDGSGGQSFSFAEGMNMDLGISSGASSHVDYSQFNDYWGN